MQPAPRVTSPYYLDAVAEFGVAEIRCTVRKDDSNIPASLLFFVSADYPFERLFALARKVKAEWDEVPLRIYRGEDKHAIWWNTMRAELAANGVRLEDFYAEKYGISADLVTGA